MCGMAQSDATLLLYYSLSGNTSQKLKFVTHGRGKRYANILKNPSVKVMAEKELLRIIIERNTKKSMNNFTRCSVMKDF